MDLELKEFEEKINNITEQFMSLLDSNDVIESSVGNKFEKTPQIFEKRLEGPTIFNTGSEEFGTISSYSGRESEYGNTNGSIFKLGTDNINFGGIAYGSNTYSNSIYNSDYVPKHAVKFDSVEQMELNKKLEGLYSVKKDIMSEPLYEKPTIAFSDSNIGRINSLGTTISYGSYTKEETDSTLNDKEVYEMANYNGGENSNNVFYSFATIPADRALVEKRDWKDVLFMDIPWDTKIDIWGGIKKFCTAQVKITF